MDNRAELLTKLCFREVLHARTRRAPASRRRCWSSRRPDQASPCRPCCAACQDRRRPLLQPYYNSLITYLLYIVMQSPPRVLLIYYSYTITYNPARYDNALLYILQLQPIAAGRNPAQTGPGDPERARPWCRRGPDQETGPRSTPTAAAPDHRRRPSQSVLKKVLRSPKKRLQSVRTYAIIVVRGDAPGKLNKEKARRLRQQARATDTNQRPNQRT